jgi:hypothetical protein
MNIDQTQHTYSVLSQEKSIAIIGGKEIRIDSKKSFLIKLYDIIDDPETDDIISWVEEGDGFIIRNVELFCSSILPRYFKHGNYSSFNRQLNMYDFYKNNKFGKTDGNIYKHPHLLRGQKDKVSLIQRKSSLNHVNNETKRINKIQEKQNM